MRADKANAQALRKRLSDEAERGGYHLNPDTDWTDNLAGGLITNEERYGYPSCPCRLATGDKDRDLDIICPCDYRDPDLNDYGACYCGLYVSDEVFRGEKEVPPVPERRPANPPLPAEQPAQKGELSLWRCRVCGYLCAREEPPEICPVCRARKERFELFVVPKSAIP